MTACRVLSLILALHKRDNVVYRAPTVSISATVK